ncbi:MAG TPA: hypothetical protein VGD17_10400 [Chitinophagaceae bacterium]
MAIILTAVYIINCFTPLRLTNDTVRYLNINTWLEDGKPHGAPASKDFLPYGYVWFLFVLSKLHIANSIFIGLFHFLYLMGSLWFIKKLFGNTINFIGLFILCLLSWATMKFVITPLSEMQFLFFSMGALYFFDEFFKQKKPLPLLWAFVFAGAAMLTRTIGIGLIVAFSICFVLQQRKILRSIIATNKVAAIVIVIILIVSFFVFDQFGITGYLEATRSSFARLQKDPAGFIVRNGKQHLINWSAFVVNAPAPRLNMIGSVAFRNTIYLITGIISFAGVIYLLLRRHGKINVLVKSYLLVYMLVILIWPFFEPRFWLPVFPLLIALIMQQWNTISGLVKQLLKVYRVYYILAGIAALSYYTYTSYNKKAFVLKQDAGKWKNEYSVHFFGKALTDSPAIREPIMRILKKHDARNGKSDQ